MSVALSPAERQRLARLLGMVGSSFDNEALNAARAAWRLVHQRGVSWEDVLGGTPASSKTTPPPSMPAWRATVAACQAAERQLTAWERQFLVSLSESTWRHLTEKQDAVLTRIATKIGCEGGS